jgi:hypothetical protein
LLTTKDLKFVTELLTEKSQVRGDQTPPLIEKTYRQLISDQVARYPFKNAFTSINEKDFTYKRFQVMVLSCCERKCLVLFLCMLTVKLHSIISKIFSLLEEMTVQT